MATLDKMLMELTNKATDYAKAYNEHQPKKTLKQIKSAVTDLVNEYNLALSIETYKQWKKEGNPIRIAIRSRIIPGAKKVHFKTDDDDYMTVVISDAEYEVNLPQMQATLGAEVFSDVNWFQKTVSLAYLIANNINDMAGNKSGFVYPTSGITSLFEFGDVDPLTDEGVQVALQQVFDAILYIDDEDMPGNNLIRVHTRTTEHGDVASQEWTTILHSMTKEIGVNSIGLCNTGKFSNLIMRAMHGILTNAVFGCKADEEFRMPSDKTDASDDEDK